MATSSLDSLTQKLEQILKLLGAVDKVAGGLNTSGGTGGTGNMSGSLAKVSTVAGKWSAVGTVMQGATAMAGGISNMMPSVELVMAREAGLYSAGVNSGGMMSRNAMNAMSMRNLGQYQNIANAGAVTSAIMTGMGIAPNSAQFTRVQTSAGQAARYLNMPNDVAAQAFGGFGSGPTSASLMRRFGIFTSNPITGASLSQKAVFDQMYNRFTGGRQANIQQTMDSLYKGYLGSAIRNSGLDSAQQEILKSQFIGKAMGQNIDFSNPESVAAAQKKLSSMGYDNVFESGMKVTAAEDRTASYATQTYTASVKAASDALVTLKDTAVKGLIDSFGGLKAYLDTFTGDHLGAGMLTAAGGGFAALAGANTYMDLSRGGKSGKPPAGMKPRAGGGYTYTKDNKYGGKAGTRVDAATAKNAVRGAKMSSGAKAGGAMGAIGAVIGLASDTPGNIAATQAGLGGSAWGKSIGSAAGSIAGGIAGGALGTLLDPFTFGMGTVVGGYLGSMAGSWLGGMAGEGIGSLFNQTGGPTSSVRTGSFSAAAKTSGAGSGTPNLKAPLKGPITCRFGVRDNMHPNGHHGIDFGVPEGTSVGAAGDGTVVYSAYDTGLGNVIKIDHGGGYVTLYAHLSQSLVSTGTTVKQWEIIGKSGNTGTLTTGPHLHFGVLYKGSPINPAPLIGIGGAVDLVAGAFASPENMLAGLGASSGDSAGSFGSSYGQAFGSVANQPQGTKLPQPYSGASYAVGNAQGGSIGIGRSGAGSRGTGTGGGYSPSMPVAAGATSGSGGGTVAPNKSGSGNNVTIHLNIQKASDSEARRFARLVKEYIEEDKFTERMGSR